MNKKNLPSTSVIIPTFNERENIVRLISEIKKLSRDRGIDIEIIVVDDDSPDKTGIVAKAHFSKDEKVRVFIRRKEKGLGTAILFGIKKAKKDVIVGMDADFNHPPEKIPVLIGSLDSADLVVASRFIEGGGMEDRRRYWFTLLFNLFLKKVLGFPTMDNMSGFYAIYKDKLWELPLEYIYRGYGEYQLRLVYLAKLKGLKIWQVPVFYPKRVYGKSKSNLPVLLFKYLLVSFELFLKKGRLFSNEGKI